MMISTLQMPSREFYSGDSEYSEEDSSDEGSAAITGEEMDDAEMV